MLENVLQILGLNVDEGAGEEPLTECTSKQWTTLRVSIVVRYVFKTDLGLLISF